MDELTLEEENMASVGDELDVPHWIKKK